MDRIMKKINFARAHQVLSEKEMKNVLGGCDGGGWCCFSDGECVLTGCISSSQCYDWYREQATCK